MSTAGLKRKNEDKTEPTTKRRKYASPPLQTPPIIYILRRNLSQKELMNKLPCSIGMAMKFELTPNVVHFGRDPTLNVNQLILDSKRNVMYKNKEYSNNIMVSREHGKFIFDNNDRRWYIFDKRSTNGIIVNGQFITPNGRHPLNVGDEIVFGRNLTDTEFKYIFEIKPAQTCMPTPQTPQTRPIPRHSQTTRTPTFDNENNTNSQSQSQPSQSQMFLDTESLERMMKSATQTMLNAQQLQFEEKMKKKEAETEALREQVRTQQIKELQMKEKENREKQMELDRKANELLKQQKLQEQTQKQCEMEMALEKQKIAEEIATQKAESQKKAAVESAKSKEREERAKQKLIELEKKQSQIEARDAKQRAKNKLEQDRWDKQQKELESEKQKILEKEKRITEKEAKNEEIREQKQQSMEEEITCCICQDLIVATRSLQCGHTMCHQCLVEWMGNSKTCPSCRQAITREPAPCLLVDNLILDTYLKDKSVSEEDREEYMARKKAHSEWAKGREAEKKRKEAELERKRKEKERQEEMRRAAAARLRYGNNQNRNVINPWNHNWGNNGNNNHNGLNNRRHVVGNAYVHANNAILGININNRNNANVMNNNNVSVRLNSAMQHRNVINNVNLNRNINGQIPPQQRPAYMAHNGNNNQNLIVRNINNPNNVFFRPRRI